MRDLSAAELLTQWEQGTAQSLPRRALALLAAACPEFDGDTLAAMTIGRRDGELLRLRERLFGPEITFVAACPACASQLESTVHAEDIQSGQLFLPPNRRSTSTAFE